MPLPPLAASERRLAQFAAGSSWLCLAFACLAICDSFGFVAAPAWERLFAAIAGAGLFGIGRSMRRTAASPRGDREAFAPLLWLLSLSAIALLIAWRREPAANLLGEAALVCGLLWAVLGFVYYRAAPGVNLGAVIAPPAADAPAKVQLGVRAAPAPLPAPVPAAAETDAVAEPKAASGASRG